MRRGGPRPRFGEISWRGAEEAVHVLSQVRPHRRSFGLLLAFAAPAAAQAATEALVNTGSPPTPFPQNKRTSRPSRSIRSIRASRSPAPTTRSTSRGAAETSARSRGNRQLGRTTSRSTAARAGRQPTYAGFSGRTGVGFGASGCTAAGRAPSARCRLLRDRLVSDGDPVVDFGLTPDASGDFSWSNGSRAYYSNLTSNFNTVREEFTFKGF